MVCVCWMCWMWYVAAAEMIKEKIKPLILKVQKFSQSLDHRVGGYYSNTWGIPILGKKRLQGTTCKSECSPNSYCSLCCYCCWESFLQILKKKKRKKIQEKLRSDLFALLLLPSDNCVRRNQSAECHLEDCSWPLGYWTTKSRGVYLNSRRLQSLLIWGLTLRTWSLCVCVCPHLHLS